MKPPKLQGGVVGMARFELCCRATQAERARAGSRCWCLLYQAAFFVST